MPEQKSAQISALEKTFVMIKPEHVEFADEILGQLDRHGTRTRTARVGAVPREVIEEHYAPHRGKRFFPWITTAFVGKPVVIAVYEGERIIGKVIELAGPTDPVRAPKHTIRGKYGTDSLDRSIEEQRGVANVIHRSDSPAEALREIRVWERYLPA